MGSYVFAGGGTGGHLFPAIAVARALQAQQPDSRITFVVSRQPLEHDILHREPFEQHAIAAVSTADLRRSPVCFAWRYWRAAQTARAWLREVQPRVVIGCGGYVSVPTSVAAGRMGIPLLLLEQNVVPGRATSWLSRRAVCVCASFEESRRWLPGARHIIVTGNPVRAEIARLAEQEPAAPAERPSLLILGGSQGAASLNRAVLRVVEQHKEALAAWRVVHQSGAEDEQAVRDRYRALGVSAEVCRFIVEMAGAYAAAAVVVSRAGATTLAELACAGRPAVLVPYRLAIRDHQRHNAEPFVRAGAAASVTDESADALAAALLPLLRDPHLRCRMGMQMRRLARPRATEQVLEVLSTIGALAAA